MLRCVNKCISEHFVIYILVILVYNYTEGNPLNNPQKPPKCTNTLAPSTNKTRLLSEVTGTTERKLPFVFPIARRRPVPSKGQLFANSKALMVARLWFTTILSEMEKPFLTAGTN